ncbi:MAG: hypothetical protein ABI599_13365 [Flavobacteriales bacterium]
MPEPNAYVDIPMARVARMDNNFVEVRIRPEARIDVTGLLGAMQARRTLLNGGKGAILFIVMGDQDWEPAALQSDFFGSDQENITAVGVLVSSRVLTLVANMYFSLFPSRFPAKVFNKEEEVRSWLLTA